MNRLKNKNAVACRHGAVGAAIYLITTLLIIVTAVGSSMGQSTLPATTTSGINNKSKHTNMNDQSFTTTLLIDKSPEDVYKAMVNVRGWWSEEIEGGTTKLNDEFKYHYMDVHTARMKLIEVVPNKKVVWQVLDNHFKFTKDQSEWKGNKVVFELSSKDGKTQLQFTQQGLVPEYECYDICKDAWTHFITESLRDLVLTGKGQPNKKEKVNEFNEDNLKKHNKQ